MSTKDESAPAEPSSRALRGRVRAKLTKYVNRIATLDRLQLTPFDREVWRRKVEKVALLYEQCDNAVSPPSTSPERLAEEAAQQSYARKLAVLQEFVREGRGSEAEDSSSDSSLSDASEAHTACHHDVGVPNPRVTRSCKIRSNLPSIVVPTFSGDVLQWPDFIATFDLLVHNDRGMSDVQKLLYLKMYVKGKAHDVVANLAPTAGHYALARKLLVRHFCKPEQAESMLLQELYNLPTARSQHDTNGLRLIADTYAKNKAALERLEVPPQSYTRNLYNVLLRTVPKGIVHEALRRLRNYSSGSNFSSAGSASEEGQGSKHRDYSDRVEAICDELEEHISTEENIESEMRTSLAGKSFITPESAKATAQGQRFGPISSIVTSTQVEARSECVFCNGAHAPKWCKLVLTSQQRREKLFAARACFRCFGYGHESRRCRADVWCERCRGRHHTWMHDTAVLYGPPSSAASAAPAPHDTAVLYGPPSSAASAEPAPSSARVVLSATMTRPTLLMQTAIVVVEGGSANRTVRVLLDPGSQSSFVREQLALDLKLKRIGHSQMEIFTVGNASPMKRVVPIFEVTLRHVRKNRRVTFVVHGLPELNGALRTATCVPKHVAELLQPYELADQVGKEQPAPVEILIGVDALAKIYTNEPAPTVSSALVVTPTIFGFVIIGTAEERGSELPKNVQVAVNACAVTRLEEAVEKMWNLETIGIQPKEVHQDAEMELRRGFENSVTRVDGRYVVHVPVRPDVNNLGVNFHVAERRLRSQLQALAQKPGVKAQYDAYMAKYVTGDFVEPVPLKERARQEMTYYMPHHPVIRPESSSTPLRVVFDCTSHTRSAKSLNDCLEEGPNLNNDLVGVLLRFREGAVGVTADIEKAFLQVGVDGRYRDLFRYLWVDAAGHVEHWRFKTLPFGAKSSPYLLLATLMHHIARHAPEHIREKLLTSFYMDDLVVSCDGLREAEDVKSQATELLSGARMRLTKWISSSAELCDEEQQEKAVVKILGLAWNRVDDTLGIAAKALVCEEQRMPVTRRSILRAVARVFDPLGYFCPVSCVGKLIFQEACRSCLQWDDPVDVELAKRFHRWNASMSSLASDRFARRYDDGDSTTQRELHVYSDFSPAAYAAVAYLRSEHSAENSVAFVMGRHRLSPLKKILTVPRGELVACMLGVRLAGFLRQHLTLRFNKIVMWADATIALAWIRGDASKYNVFVANRMREIQRATAEMSLEWRHCPGKLNPADRATRGVPTRQFLQEKLWQDGPAYLRCARSEWPATPEEEDERVQEELCRPVVVNVVTTEEKRTLLDWQRFSSSRQFVRVCENVLRFIKRRCPVFAGAEPDVVVIRLVQVELFQRERCCICADHPVPGDAPLRGYQLRMDSQGLLRVVTRLSGNAFSPEEKEPIVLAEHPYVRLLVRECHERLFHAGVAHMMAELRQRFYVLRLRKMCRQVVADCVCCKRYRKAKDRMLYAPLPEERECASRPFENVGIDFTGPFYTKENGGAVKAYIALFCCLVTRGVHLELVSSLSAESFLDAFRRFAAHRQLPRVVYTDNALAFSKAKGDIAKLFKLLKDPQLKQHFQQRAIVWKFTTPYAPWTGGAWERLMQVVKNPLKKVLKAQLLTFERFVTVLKEIEAVVNSRPLLAGTSDCEEAPVLTPAHFMAGGPALLLPPTTAKLGSAWWRQREQLLASLWRRFRGEYLLYCAAAAQPGDHGHIITRRRGCNYG